MTRILLAALALVALGTAAWAHQRCVPICTNHSDGTQQCYYECYQD
jgi:hypothetical protein